MNMNVENGSTTQHSRLLLLVSFCTRTHTHTHKIHTKNRFNKPFHITDSFTFAKMRLILNGATLRITKSVFGLFWVLSLAVIVFSTRLTGWVAGISIVS